MGVFINVSLSNNTKKTFPSLLEILVAVTEIFCFEVKNSPVNVNIEVRITTKIFIIIISKFVLKSYALVKYDVNMLDFGWCQKNKIPSCIILRMSCNGLKF